jgi:hypothetical protein
MNYDVTVVDESNCPSAMDLKTYLARMSDGTEAPVAAYLRAKTGAVPTTLLSDNRVLIVRAYQAGDEMLDRLDFEALCAQIVAGTTKTRHEVTIDVTLTTVLRFTTTIEAPDRVKAADLAEAGMDDPSSRVWADMLDHLRDRAAVELSPNDVRHAHVTEVGNGY